MANKATFSVKFRRRREGKTNYKKRLALVKSGKIRLVVRDSNTGVKVQAIEMQKHGDKIVAEFNSKKLDEFGWVGSRNIPSAYLTGFACGFIAIKNNAKEAVFDLGFRAPVHGSIPFAALKGAIDAGMNIPHDEKALADPNRVSGKHIEEYVEKLGEEEFNKRFSRYVKEGFDVKNISKKFEEVKEKISNKKW